MSTPLATRLSKGAVALTDPLIYCHLLVVVSLSAVKHYSAAPIFRYIQRRLLVSETVYSPSNPLCRVKGIRNYFDQSNIRYIEEYQKRLHSLTSPTESIMRLVCWTSSNKNELVQTGIAAWNEGAHGLT